MASKYFKQNEITKASSRILSKELEVQNEKIQALSFELTATYNNLLSMYPIQVVSETIKNINFSINITFFNKIIFLYNGSFFNKRIFTFYLKNMTIV